MAVHLKRLGISYFSVPKCACTSIKTMFFEIENGFPFKDFMANETWYHIHKIYPTRTYDSAAKLTGKNDFKFTVIRSPKARIMSCYKHWVAPVNSKGMFKEKEAELLTLSLPVDPNFIEFVEHLEGYRKVLPHIAHHTEPLSYFLGADPDYFDEIYNLGNLSELPIRLETITGMKIPIEHENVSQKVEVPQSEGHALELKINDLFQEDFDIYERFWK